jgi:hypothetical protein
MLKTSTRLKKSFIKPTDNRITGSGKILTRGFAALVLLILTAAVFNFNASASTSLSQLWERLIGGSAAAVTVTVTQHDLINVPSPTGGWLFFNDENNTVDNTLGSFVSGPGTAPAGSGSVQISVSGTQRRNLATYQFGGTVLSNITELKFSTYNPSAGNGGSANRSGYLQFNVDFNGTDTWQRRLVYVPSDNGAVVQNSWQEWDTINGGAAVWRYSSGNFPAPNPSATKTWAQILADYPGVRMRVSDSFFGIRVGEPYADGYTENIDAVKFGVSGNTTVFDFERAPVIVVDADGFASATNCNDASTPATTTIAAAVAAALPGDTIRVCSGTYNVPSTINLNKSGLTILGVGAARPVIQIPTSTGYGFTVTASGVTLDNLEIAKADLGSVHNMMLINANNFTAQNNLIYGPNPGGTWNSVGLTSRAFEVAGGLTGLLIQNNTIHTLRQPAYINTSSGSILNNNVSGTKGWVIDGSTLTFTGNTWGEPQNQDCDIALLASVNPANYPARLAMSAANDNAFICAQYAGGENGRANAFVTAGASGGNGSDNANYGSINGGIAGTLAGGTVTVAAGTYVEAVNVNKSVSLIGPNANINPNTGARVAEAIIRPPASNPIDPGFTGPIGVTLAASNITFNGFTVDGDNPALTSGVVFNGVDVDAEFGIYGPENVDAKATINYNIVKNIGEFGIWIDEYLNNGTHSNSSVQFNKVDNIPGAAFGQGIRTADNAFANITDNVVSRVAIGIVIENIGFGGAHPASSISNNQITAFIYGIRHNLHYNYSGNGFTIDGNTINSYVDSYRSFPRFNGIRVESIQQNVPVTVSNNTIAPNRALLLAQGYTRIDGINITNDSTTSPNISITGNNISNTLRGILHNAPAVPSITCNLLSNNNVGVFVGLDTIYGTTIGSNAGSNINNNNIVGNTVFGVQNGSAFTTNAINNFWGSASGPGGAGPGTGDAVSPNVNFAPFLTALSTCGPTAISISGTITKNALPLAGVTVTLSGTQSGTATTDANGNYVFYLYDLPATNNLLLTPSLAGHTFEPNNLSYTNVTSNITNADFVGFTGSSTRVVRVVSKEGTPGQSVVVPVELVSQGNENSLGFSVVYDPALLSNPVVALGNDALSASLTVNNATSGQTGVLIGLPSGQTFAAGTRQIVKVTYTISNSIPVAVYSTPVALGNSPIVRQVTNTNADPLPTTYTNGTVTFAKGLEADVAPRPHGSGTLTVSDYTQVGNFVAGLNTPDAPTPTNEYQRADSAPRGTKGDGFLTVSDYTQAGRYAAGLDAAQTAGGPTVSSLFEGFRNIEIYKEVNGKSVLLPRILRVVSTTGSKGQQVFVAIQIDAEGDENGVGFTLNYDSAVLGNPLVSLGPDLSTGTFFQNSMTPGRLGVVAAAQPLSVIQSGTRHILTVRFNVSPTAPTGQTLLDFVGFPPVFNEVSSADANPLPTTFTGGFVDILAPTAASAGIKGTVSSATGETIRNAIVSITDTNGNTRSARTNSFGKYQFENVQTGETYTVQVSAKGYQFTPMIVSVVDELTEFDLTAEP